MRAYLPSEENEGFYQNKALGKVPHTRTFDPKSLWSLCISVRIVVLLYVTENPTPVTTPRSASSPSQEKKCGFESQGLAWWHISSAPELPIMPLCCSFHPLCALTLTTVKTRKRREEKGEIASSKKQSIWQISTQVSLPGLCNTTISQAVWEDEFVSHTSYSISGKKRGGENGTADI